MASDKTGKAGGSSPLLMIVVILLLTLAAMGAGLAAGSMLEFPVAAMPAKPPPPAAEGNSGHEGSKPAGEGEAEVAAPAETSQMKVMPFPPVLTSLAEPKGVWIRIEGSMLVLAETEDKPEILVEQAGAHLLAYLRTVKLAQIEGPSGLLHLREDMNDVVSTMSRGQVREVLIHALVVE